MNQNDARLPLGLPRHTLTGATIDYLPTNSELPRVRKSGGTTNLAAQAEIMHRVGQPTFPRVYDVDDGSYAMDWLLPQPAPLSFRGSIARLVRIKKMLPAIWGHAPLEFARQQGGWRRETQHWCALYAPWLAKEFYRLYVDSPWFGEERLTHGDPTLSNVMLDQSLEMRLIDPAPPRFGVPQLGEVDLGKLLQSVAGWEHLNDSSWPCVVDDMVDEAITYLTSGYSRNRAVWWGAFHCARVMTRYADDARLSSWGLAASRMLLGKIRS